MAKFQPDVFNPFVLICWRLLYLPTDLRKSQFSRGEHKTWHMKMSTQCTPLSLWLRAYPNFWLALCPCVSVELPIILPS